MGARLLEKYIRNVGDMLILMRNMENVEDKG